MAKGFRAIDRRTFIAGAGATSAAVAGGTLFAPAVHAQENVIRLGYVSPQTGPLAAFAEADDFVITNFMETAGVGTDIGGTT